VLFRSLGAADYLALAAAADALYLSGLPRLSTRKRDEARRLVTLVDALYEGRVALHLAAEEDDVAVLTLLLDSGAQIDARNASQQTALTIAIVESSCEAIALLIARGASCAVDDDEWIGKGSTPLHYVSARGRLDVVKQLLASADGAVKINALDARGFSPLHHAVRSRKVAVVQALLDAGADASLPNSLGLSAKQLAATRDVFCGFEWPE
jgi:ankyrin repeat protein